MNTSSVYALIDEYVSRTGIMPTHICGKFCQLIELEKTPSYVTVIEHGDRIGGIQTCCGLIRFQLDPKADDIYLAEI